MKTKHVWELLTYQEGVTWHDRQGDIDCDRLVIGTPYSLADIETSEEALCIANEKLGAILGEIKLRSTKETRERLHDWRNHMVYFDFKFEVDRERWKLIFKKRAHEGVTPKELSNYLKSL